MKIKVRSAELKDVAGCLEIQKMWNDDFSGSEDFENAVKDDDAIFLVALDDDSIVGFVTGSINLVKRSECYLQETMVNPSFKHKGIGTKLVNSFCDFVKEKGVKEIYSELEEEHIPFYIGACEFKDRGSHVLAVKKLE